MKLKPAVGRWFHTFKAGEVQFQGQVVAAGYGRYQVQQHSFDDGEANGSPKWVAAEDMVDWMFYESDADMRAAWASSIPGGDWLERRAER